MQGTQLRYVIKFVADIRQSKMPSTGRRIAVACGRAGRTREMLVEIGRNT